MAPDTDTTLFLNASDLAARGWTPAMIRDFLGSPDTTIPNPRFRRAAPTLQFELSRVEAIESTGTFAWRRGKAERRSVAAKAAARRRRLRMLRLSTAKEVPVPELDPAVLEARAIRHRDAMSGKAADVRTLDHRILNRWKVNYLRRQLTRYDPVIEGLFGEIGRADIERVLLRRFLEAIGRKYPDLQDECQRQLRAFSQRDQRDRR